MTEMFGEAWSPMSVPDLAPDDDDDEYHKNQHVSFTNIIREVHILNWFLSRGSPRQSDWLSKCLFETQQNVKYYFTFRIWIT